MATKKKQTTAAVADAATATLPARPAKKKKPSAAAAEETATATADAAKKKKKAKPTHPALSGKKVAFFGKFLLWPGYHHAQPATVAKRHGATVVEEVDDSVDVVVFGDGTGQKAEAKKKAERLIAKGASLQIIDEAAFREWVRIDLKGKRFAFAGGFDLSPNEAEDGLLRKMAENVGAVVDEDVTGALDYLVVGARRADKRIARLNQAKKLVEEGAELAILDEHDFLMLVRTDAPLSSTAAAAAGTGGGSSKAEFSTFIGQLYTVVDEGKLGRALKMLKGESFKLFTKLDSERLVGVVKSQTGSADVYAPWMKSDGSFGCCTQSLDECMGLGGVCKHLLVVVLGLVRTDNLPAGQALQWLKATKKKAPTMDKDGCAVTFLEYKGAQAGTVDWRPTETLPEDFMAL